MILPQCPAARANQWLGPRKDQRDSLLSAIADLVRIKAQEFSVPSNRIFAAGVDSGGDACWALMNGEPGLFARALVAGAAPPPKGTTLATKGKVRVSPGENRKASIDNAFSSKSIDWLLQLDR